MNGRNRGQIIMSSCGIAIAESTTESDFTDASLHLYVNKIMSHRRDRANEMSKP
jgi:hypothetical protein